MFAVSCLREPAAPARVAVLLQLTADQQVTGERVDVVISGEGLDPPITATLRFVNDTARGEIEVPAGLTVTVRVDVFNAANARVATGETTARIGSGISVTVPLQLRTLTGTIPVTVVGQVIIVGVTPATAAVRAGGAANIAVQVRDSAGQPVSVPVTWGVDRPPAAWVSPTGDVQLLDTGVVRVTASAGNRAAATTLTGTPGTVLGGITLAPDSLRSAGGSSVIDVAVRDPAGIDSVVVGTRTPAGAAGPSCLATTPVSGTRANGTFRCLLIVPAAAASGRWPIGPVRVHAGAFTTTLDTTALRHRGAAAALRVIP
ncbi:MAG: hypothetical protein MUF53_05120 [Gemmatimonadaceae bacterium]|nr:hypothetical protein [Gemmatimonadaceae bacterium]